MSGTRVVSAALYRLVVWAGDVVVDSVAACVEPAVARMDAAAARTKRYFLKLSGFCCYKFKREKIKPGLECD